MQYRSDRAGNPISTLGFGCMRFSHKGAGIDVSKAEAELMRARELGVNYFDTAYLYQGSEELLGEVFERNGCREDVLIATKLPQYLVRKAPAIDRYFDEELRRLRTDYIDYYLMHLITDVQQWRNLCGLGIEDWIARKKASGAIRNIGFSFHGSTELFLEVLDAYDWDFCQIQYNYLDEHTQAGRRGLRAAAGRGIPVIIMEPLRGGALGTLPRHLAEQLKAVEPERSIASWAFRFCGSFPKVLTTLSGMTYMDHLDDNLLTFCGFKPLSGSDFELLEKIADEHARFPLVGCTGCQYCMPCPYGINIPGVFRFYDDSVVEGSYVSSKEQEHYARMRRRYLAAYNKTVESVRQADHCISCGQCAPHCPQHIRIPRELRRIDEYIESLKQETL